MRIETTLKCTERVFGLEVALAIFGGTSIKKYVFLVFKDVIYTLKKLHLKKKATTFLTLQRQKPITKATCNGLSDYILLFSSN